MKQFEKCMNVIGFFASSSRVICSPPVLTTDEDYVIYTDKPSDLKKELTDLGYVYSAVDAEKYKTSDKPAFEAYNRFDTYRHPVTNENLIVVFSTRDFRKWRTSTLLATKLNLTKKEDRVALFRVVRSEGQLFDSWG